MIYLNNATSGWPKRESALSAYNECVLSPPSDVRHSVLPQIEDARSRAAALLGQKTEHVYFVPDATLAINIVLRGGLLAGTACLADNRQHNAVVRTLFGMAGVDARYIDIYDFDDRADYERLFDALKPDVSFVCLMHTSNVTGSIYEIGPVIAEIRQRRPDVSIFVDASQMTGVADLAPALEADFVVFPGHKHLRALPGAAVLIAKRRLNPVVFGGTGADSTIRDLRDFRQNVVEVGTPNVPAIVALVRALEHDTEVEQEEVASLLRRLWAGLEGIDGIRLLGRRPGDRRNGTIAVSVRGNPEREWVPYLAGEGVICRGGLHCCPHFHEAAASLSAGTLRFSLSAATHADETERVIELTAQFGAVLRDLG